MVMDYSALDRQIVISEGFDDGILLGYGISSDRMPAFLRDVEDAARRYGAVPFDELLYQDESDAAIASAIRARDLDSRRSAEAALRINLSEGDFEVV